MDAVSIWILYRFNKDSIGFCMSGFCMDSEWILMISMASVWTLYGFCVSSTWILYGVCICMDSVCTGKICRLCLMISNAFEPVLHLRCVAFGFVLHLALVIHLNLCCI